MTPAPQQKAPAVTLSQRPPAPLLPSNASLSTERLWHDFAAGVRAFVRRRVPPSEVEDVVQDVFLRIHERASLLRDETRAPAWVYAIARHAVADFYRRRARRPAALSAEAPLPDADAASPEPLARYDGAHSVHEEVLSWLRPMIGALPEKYARPLRWADVEGVPQKEIARRLGLSLSGAKSRIQRARKQLGEVLAACCAVEFGSEGRATGFRRKTPKRDADCCDG